MYNRLGRLGSIASKGLYFGRGTNWATAPLTAVITREASVENSFVSLGQRAPLFGQQV